ncbi:hypothetical protein A2311_05325 [candidate division WOR-1 bacterium RIFOXYB2_FULL_48_7]|uniref:Uncharacterized protein n=1 Tax=candidate division WOR-1 bacterium RIFOXYB2_FULL_48_7 TaxID=1802583 RepID=A0A1F4TS82_UNCSA|nr:MAG: hypothetical protein A2311_05325 [candidate division WOR-1 bacterium RIFOXYB2_FULL_48_7]
MKLIKSPADKHEDMIATRKIASLQAVAAPGTAAVQTRLAKLKTASLQAWAKIDAVAALPLGDLLRLERGVLIDCGFKSVVVDRNRWQTRETVLARALPEERADYIDLLQTISAAHAAAREYGDAERLLTTILEVEEVNRSAWRDLAILHVNQRKLPEALTAFDRMNMIPAESWFEDPPVGDQEASRTRALESYIRVTVAINDNPALSAEQLLVLITPFMKADFDELDKAIWLEELKALMKARLPWQTIARFYSLMMAGDEQIQALQVVGPFSKKVTDYLENLADRDEVRDLAELAAIFPANDPSPAGAVATLYTYFQLRAAYQPNEAGKISAGQDALLKARAALKRLEKSKLGLPGSGKVLKQVLDELELKNEALKTLDELQAAVGQIKEGGVSRGLGQKIVKLAARIPASILAEDEAINVFYIELQAALFEAAAAVFRADKKLVGAVLFFSELSKAAAWQPLVAQLVETKLADPAIYRAVKEELVANREAYRRAAKKILNTHATMGALKKGALDFSGKDEDSLFFDFFLVHFCSLSVCHNLAEELFGLPLAPTSLASLWYSLLAENQPAGITISLLEKGADQPAGALAMKDLAYELATRGKLEDCSRVLARLERLGLSPELKINLLHTKVVGIGEVLKKVRRTPQWEREAARLLPQLTANFEEVESFMATMGKTKPWMIVDLESILQNCGYVFSLAHEFTLAERSYKLLLQIDPNNVNALLLGGYNYLKLGLAMRAGEIARVIAERTKGAVQAAYLIMSEAYRISFDKPRALESAEKVLAIEQGHLDFLFLQARLMIDANNLDGAKMTLAVFESVLTRGTLPALSVPKASGYIEILRGEIAFAEHKNEAGEAALRKAIELLSFDLDAEYWEIEARLALIDKLSYWANESDDEAVLERVSALATESLALFPFSPYLRTAATAPLLLSGRMVEAVAEIEWLFDNKYLSSETLANLLLIRRQAEGEAIERAQALLDKIKAVAATDDFTRGLVVKAAQIIVEKGLPPLEDENG